MGVMMSYKHEDKLNNRYVEVYFKDETHDLKLRAEHDLKLRAEHVYSVEIEDGFLKIFDSYDKILHCFNINNVSHYHVPDEVFGRSL